MLKKVYEIREGNSLTEVKNSDTLKVRFQIRDSASYTNKYESPEVTYYEVGDFKGRPSIVPIDVSKGWYAATRAGSGTMKAFDDSGGVNYFYLCNVMEDGKADFNSGVRDDECRGVNALTKQVDGSFYPLSDSEVKGWVEKGISAIKEASRKYEKGMPTTISILDQKGIKIGNPAVNLPGTQCTDFMSPKDCNLLFNLCDPVVCPSSRCDFGGRFPVSNVIQSGIIGGLLLCLPNFPQVKVPICLTGINAGIQSLISVYTNYRDCLQKNLDSGETVGICDEMHSIYLCGFFWKQALPLSKLVFTNVLLCFKQTPLHN